MYSTIRQVYNIVIIKYEINILYCTVGWSDFEEETKKFTHPTGTTEKAGFWFKNNIHTNVLLVGIFENALKKPVNRQ